jgi:hypothetical protein
MRQQLGTLGICNQFAALAKAYEIGFRVCSSSQPRTYMVEDFSVEVLLQPILGFLRRSERQTRGARSVSTTVQMVPEF